LNMPSVEPLPAWTSGALQGLAFWIGHRHSLYRHYPLTEGAIVAELCNLIHSNLSSDEMLLCEQPYRSLIAADGKWPTAIRPGARVDLVVANRGRSKDEPPRAKFVIEVKRASGADVKIDEDLTRLAELKSLNSELRTFLFVISERSRPKRFVTESGGALTNRRSIAGTSCVFKVRRVCKATASFKKAETAHYACLIEVCRS
jgi:hypothetical protein